MYYVLSTKFFRKIAPIKRPSMKNLKYKILFAALVLGCIITIAQTGKEEKAPAAKAEMSGKETGTKISTADLMRENLNEPNAVSPAMNNLQQIEVHGITQGKNIHPKEDLSNKYNRNSVK